MKIYKIMIAMIAICFIAGIASAGTFSDAENDNDIHFNFPTMEFAKDGAVMKELTPAGDSVEVYIPSINPHNIPSYIPVQIQYMTGQC